MNLTARQTGEAIAVRPTICLAMIVRDEAPVIERCLTSVRSHVGSWLIVDTGSTDGTQDLVRKLMADLPGELIERPWIDFGHNRTEALEAARPRADYTFVIDADEVLDAPAVGWPALTGDSAMLNVRMGGRTYRRTSLVANRLPWRYVGVLHEYLAADGAAPGQMLDHPSVIVHQDGARGRGLSAVEKYARDVETLRAALVVEPDNARYQFYLARSLVSAGRSGEALGAFRRRAEMVGFAEETFDSLLDIGRLLEGAGEKFDTVHRAYLAAWEYRPRRAEPLYELARYARLQKRFALARMAAWQAMAIPRPNDLLWVQDDVYTWRARDEYSIAAYWSGDREECRRVCAQLLDGDQVPAQERERVLANLAHAEKALGRRQAA